MVARAGSGGTLRRDAWAKVNLTLHVTGRRADGYHELDSLIVFAGVGDELALSPAERLVLEVEGPFAAALGGTDPQANLVLRAAAALQARFGVARGARCRLVKRLPVAAGLGGGSADAAAALRGLAALWGVTADDGALADLAAGLGADVPVCLAARPSLVSGIGEVVRPAPPLPPVWLVLANPGVALSTPAVFEARRGAFSAPAHCPRGFASALELAHWLAACGNDLEEAARGLAPDIAAVLGELGATDGCLLARMSGSGATCFGLYEGETRARGAAEALAAVRPGWWVAAAPVLTGAREDSD
jgi:4-diphosphocytidyl-2-C-methyl-D-erythritol kinase